MVRVWHTSPLNPALIGPLSMIESARLYHCCRCYAQVIVCRSCDHGQRYCANGCSRNARVESRKRANQKYQRSRVGRFNNAARQASFRARQKQKVTDQGSIQSRHHAVLKTALDKAECLLSKRFHGTVLRCHHCGKVCESHLRSDFLQSHQSKRSFRRGWYPD